MNWNLRYAVSAESVAQIQSVLPTGWLVRGHENGYKVPDPMNRTVDTNYVKVYNPLTKNEATVYDHEPLFSADKKKRDNWRHHNWNFLDHHQEIGEGLKHLDYLARATQYEQGFHLDMRRHDRDKNQEEGIAAYTYNNADRDIFFLKPSSFHYKGTMDPAKIPQERKNAWVKEVVSHEVGHINMFQNNNLGKFLALQKKWVQHNFGVGENDPSLNDSNMLNTETTCSHYGKTNPEENYAEHFAAWMSGDTNPRSRPSDFTFHTGYAMRWPVTRQIAKWNHEVRAQGANLMPFIHDAISPGISNFSNKLSQQIEQQA